MQSGFSSDLQVLSLITKFSVNERKLSRFTKGLQYEYFFLHQKFLFKVPTNLRCDKKVRDGSNPDSDPDMP